MTTEKQMEKDEPADLLKSVRNPLGIEVNVCCGSCAFKNIEGYNPKRLCEKKEIEVDTFDCCDDWQMSKHLQHVGEELGRVKRRLYLMYVLRARLMEKEAVAEGTMKIAGQASVDELREKFETDYGISPYMGK